ncbi:MAG: hypothetical protein JJE22_05545 [Bacteroidia bacterium]|nr:hypothetical protein [Bacteroidia bacterium]
MSKSLEKKSKLKEEKNQENGITQKPHSTGKTTEQIMHRHLLDMNDIITEEDFKNLNIEPDISNDPRYQPLQIPEGTKRPKDEDKDPSILIPWDLLNE